MTNSGFVSTVPTIENRKVTPLRRPNADMRSREYLTPAEVDSLVEAVKKNRHGHRDSTMVLMAYRHGLRVSELVELRWSQVDFEGHRLHVCRAKKGSPSTHPLQGDEMRALRKLRREAPHSDFVFMTERVAPFSTSAFAKLVEKVGEVAKL